MSTMSDHDAAIACCVFSLMACAVPTVPGKVGPSPEASKASLSEPVSVCAKVAASSAARFSHFAPLGPVHLGGLVIRLQGATGGSEALLRDLGLQGVVTRQCPNAQTLVWLPGGTLRLAELFSARGLQVSETVVLDPAEGRAWRLAECKLHPDNCPGSQIDGAAQP